MPNSQIDFNEKTLSELSSIKQRLQRLEALEGIDSSILPYLSHNLIKNYPSLEKADGAAPEWWTASSANITEEDATGEGIGSPPNERLIKIVTTGASGGIYQSFTLSVERLLEASVTKISGGVWVYVVTAGTLTFRLYDLNNAVVLGSDTTTTTGGWVYLQVNNVTLGAGASSLFQLYHSENGATFYIANPVMNTGPVAIQWQARGLTYREEFYDLLVNTNPASTAWAGLSIAAASSTNAAAFNLAFQIRDSGTSDVWLYVRRNGSGAAQDSSTTVLRAPGGYINAGSNAFILGDDGQTIQYSVSNASADIVRISMRGYWEWE